MDYEEEEEIVDLEKFEVKEKLGNGSFGVIYLIETKDTHERYAAKVSKNSASLTNNFKKELKTYLKAKHPTILDYYGYSPNNFNNQPYPTVILEYMPNGSLNDLIKSDKKRLAGTTKYIIILGIAIGMKFLHSIKIIHRDLKAQNILLDENYYPRICDFGESYLSDNLNLSKLLMHSYKGTPKYMAPEIFKEDFYTYKIDVYSFSFVMYEIITEKIAFSNYKSINKLHIDVLKGIRPDLSLIQDEYVQNFIRKCWDKNHQNRPSFNEIVEEIQSEKFKKYFNVNEEEVSKYLEMIKKEQSDSPYLFKYKADEGDIGSMLIYGCGCLIGLNKKKEALKYFKMAADKGSIIGLHNYLNLYSLYGENKDECRHYVEKAIELYPDDPVILYNCGNCYAFGKCGEINYEKAAELFKLSSDKEFPYAMYNYGKSLMLGYGVPINKEEGIKYIKKVADLNYEDAIVSYGESLCNGEGCEMNITEGVKYLKYAADKGNECSAYIYSKLLLSGTKMPINIEEGLKYLKIAADKRFNDSCLLYADILSKGDLIKPNKKEAAKYYKISADDGDIDAMIKYANMLIEGDGIEMNINEGIKYLKLASKNGNYEAYAAYGLLLYLGIKIQQNKKKAALYLKKSADNGIASSQWIYGTMLLNGDGIEINKKEAIKYIKMAADNNFEFGMIDYAKANLDGDDNTLEKQEALQMIKNLADKGSKAAMYEYGCILKYGKYDTNKDETEASRYFKLSGEKGETVSMYEYATMLLNKNGDSQNIQEGYKYLKMAADNGFTPAMIDYSKAVIEDGKIEEGIHYLKMAIDFNDDSAMVSYGIILFNGSYEIPVNKKEAAKYFKMAADRENIVGMKNYVSMLMKGDGIEKNIKEAEIYLKILADNGDDQSMNTYGALLLTEDKNELEAYKYFKMGADKGNKHAMYNLSSLLRKSSYIKHDYKLALEYLKKSADLGLVIAMMDYGGMKYFSEDIENDEEEGFKYIEMAYKNREKDPHIGANNIELLYAAFMVFERKEEKNKSKFIQIIKKHVDAGDSMALGMYGYALENGLGIEKNTKDANRYYKMAADAKDIETCITYGYNLIYGNYIHKNIDEGIKYLKIAVDSGDIEAIEIYTQVLFELKEKKQIDINELVHYLQILCDNGDIYNMFNYGLMLLNGDEIPMNKEKASYYFKKSADKGFELSIYQYGLNLYYGDGVPVNKAESAKYLKRAANKGVIYSMYKYGQLFKDKINEVVIYLKNEIEKENTFAMYLYAEMLYKGEGIKMNKEKALYYFIISALKGNIYSMMKIVSKSEIFHINIFITMLFTNTILTQQKEFCKANQNFAYPCKNDYVNKKKNSIQLLEMGVAQNDLKSIIKYAEKLYNGTLLKVDKVRAAELFKMAADMGDVYSMKRYGCMLLLGDGIAANKNEAFRYLQKFVSFDTLFFY